VRLTHGGMDASGTHGLDNGDMATVTGLKAGKIILDNGVTLPERFGHLTHGYCVTSHASQGKTVDRVLIAENAWSAKVAGSREQLYVSVSRGRDMVKIYTDSKAQLLEGVMASSARMLAHEVTARQVVQAVARQAAEVVVSITAKVAAVLAPLQSLMEKIKPSLAPSIEPAVEEISVTTQKPKLKPGESHVRENPRESEPVFHPVPEPPRRTPGYRIRM
jgi:hypothetical protein